MRQTGTVSERFWAFVDKSDGCWLWNGSLNNKGYGEIGGDAGGPNVLAHRASWKIHFGELPNNVGVLHRCDNPRCVNPSHLFLGTQKVNMLDCKAKGRTTLGERNRHAKLTNENILEIRSMADAGMLQTEIARLFNISASTISMIVNKKHWSHIA